MTPASPLAGITMRDLTDLEAATGRPVGSLLELLGEDGDTATLDALTLAGLLWVRMRKDSPGLTFDDVLDMDLGTMAEEGLEDLPKVSTAPTPLRASGSASPGPGGAHRSRSETSTSAS